LGDSGKSRHSRNNNRRTRRSGKAIAAGATAGIDGAAVDAIVLAVRVWIANTVTNTINGSTTMALAKINVSSILSARAGIPSGHAGFWKLIMSNKNTIRTRNDEMGRWLRSRRVMNGQ
jgi:hypothetical protein